ncbi:MAG: ABC transporter ATP-binding protein [Deltaproteobacteria bacterium]|nr:ABC transporter ATP-binding protein [Deltaproteobacteria bacterium]
MSLIIKDFSVVYRDGDHGIQAVEEVTLAVKKGECLALVGESGSGKTTLGRACLGLLHQNAETTGRIILNDREMDFSNEQALNHIRWQKISMVFQNGAETLNPAYRIMDQVAEPLRKTGGQDRKAALERASRALLDMGLPEDCHGRYPHQLSGGQVQRALLAMATILDPDILIMDEPTSALDALNKSFVSDIIEDYKERGKGVLLITHDLEFAVAHGDEMAVLYLGQVMETLPAGELFRNPLHPYTMALGRSYPTMDTARELGGIRGDAFYRLVHQHGRRAEAQYHHSHIQIPESAHADGHAPPTGCLFQGRCTQAIEACKTGVVNLEAVGHHGVRCLRRGIVRMLSLKKVSKQYDHTMALNPTDLALKAGDLLSLVGETGSGKTTLAMIAAGVLPQDHGTRILEDRDMDEWLKKNAASMARKVGVVYQNPAASISHRFTVFDAVAEPLTIHGIGTGRDERKEMVKSVLADVHLSTDDAFLGRYPHELNMGALQRICIARALILSPSLLIADEPTSALDPSVQAKVLKLLLDLQTERGLTMLFVSHDIALARKISDRMGIMLAGHLVELGRSSRILSHPAHPYTKMLLEGAGGNRQVGWKMPPDEGASKGCPFFTRCSEGKDLCQDEFPSIRKISHGWVACHLTDV